VVLCLMVDVINLVHHANSYDGRSSVIPHKTEGLIIKIAEVTIGNQRRIVNVSRTLRTFFKKSSQEFSWNDMITTALTQSQHLSHKPCILKSIRNARPLSYSKVFFMPGCNVNKRFENCLLVDKLCPWILFFVMVHTVLHVFTIVIVFGVFPSHDVDVGVLVSRWVW
jgi:hypothetical protein